MKKLVFEKNKLQKFIAYLKNSKIQKKIMKISLNKKTCQNFYKFPC